MKRRQFLFTLATVPVIPALMRSTPPSKEGPGNYAPELVEYDDVELEAIRRIRNPGGEPVSHEEMFKAYT